jgi:moderate conductance mechanosensitive channel
MDFIGMTSRPLSRHRATMPETLMSRIFGHFSGHHTSAATRIGLIVVIAILVHVLVRITRSISDWIILKSHSQRTALGFVSQQPKFLTLTKLIVSGVTFVIYFLALGLVLEEFGVNLTAYLASASVIGLAISFGSQGLVQDIVTGLTVIFSDAMDVGDMVEIVGLSVVTGRVEEIGLRFTRLVNFYNQQVLIPNRTIANVSRFPLGGVEVYADVMVPDGADHEKVVEAVTHTARGFAAQFSAIVLDEPAIGPVESSREGAWCFVRVRFKIWPGQGALIDSTFRQQMIRAMRPFDAAYADWQVPVTYRARAVARPVKGP